MKKRSKNLRHRNRKQAASFGFEKLENRKLMAAVIGSETAAIQQEGIVQPAIVQTDDALPNNGNGIQRIVNGEQTDQFEAVGFVGPLGCTGTLISPTHVLTAAHCTEGVSDPQGTFEVNGQTYRTTRIFNHPDYNPNNFSRGDDLAIMELDRPVTGVTPMQIFRQTPQVGTMLTLVGFGEGGTSTGGFDPNDTGKQVGQTELEAVTQEHITWTFDSHDESNTAPGDSGGPAFIQANGQYLIAGVTSGGAQNAHALGGESFDTRIDVHAAWIDGIVGSNSGGGNGGDDNDTGGDDGGSTGDDHVNQPNDNATEISLDSEETGTAEGVFEAAGDRDAFRFTVQDAGQTVITLTENGSDVDTYLRIYNSNSELIGENDDFGNSYNSQVSLDLAAGEYFAVAGTYDDSGTGAFDINVQHDAVVDTGDNDQYTTFSNDRNKLISDSGRNRVSTGITVNNLQGTISDLNVTVDIDHTWVSDLRLVLVAPDRTRIVLVNRQGEDGQNFESTTFDQQASQHINRGDVPFRGTFRPAHSLDTLNGKMPNGRWRLVVLDLADGDGGQLNGWSMDIKTNTGRDSGAGNRANLVAGGELSGRGETNSVSVRRAGPTMAGVSSTLAGAARESLASRLPARDSFTDQDTSAEISSTRSRLLDTVFGDDLFTGLL